MCSEEFKQTKYDAWQIMCIKSISLKISFLFMYVCVRVCAAECRSPQKLEEGIGFPGAGIAGCELSGGCLELQMEALLTSELPPHPLNAFNLQWVYQDLTVL